MTLADWLASHPYLQPMAELRAQVDRAILARAIPAAPIPDWSVYGDDFHAGVPLLQSAHVTIDVSPVESALHDVLDTLSTTPLAARRNDAGWQRFLRSTVLAGYLRDLIPAFGRWRDEERWLRPSCPTCGSGPAMAHLVGTDPGRLRVLVCGVCRTHWRFRRTACPFCENRDDHRLPALDVTGEGGLRVDYCESCRGYIKTYNGTGNEAVLLADWTSLHLDILARDRGLERRATSVYEI